MGAEAVDAPKGALAASQGLAELPRSVVQRLVRKMLPDKTMLSKDATSALGTATAVFVLYATAAANEVTRAAKRTTVTSDDVLKAIEEAEFDEFLPTLTAFRDGMLFVV